MGGAPRGYGPNSLFFINGERENPVVRVKVENLLVIDLRKNPSAALDAIGSPALGRIVMRGIFAETGKSRLSVPARRDAAVRLPALRQHGIPP